MSTRATNRAESLPADPLRTGEHVRVERAPEPAEVLDTAAAFKRYAPYVAKIGMRMLGRRDELDDFVQDVFLSVHRHLATVREPAALKGWLAKVAVREAMARLRRRKLRNLLGLGTGHDYEAVADAAASPEERTQLARVFAALDTLSASERVVWSLRHVEGETLERVAELCGVSLSTAKRRLASAEAALEKLGVGRV
ncbi:MAG TPA: sigma-70 family RNA polymerase sigma factor [Polyangiales bacterium]|nr:sigma-70 family RNA polymerase sigma factor [Polyangiales bacterium]